MSKGSSIVLFHATTAGNLPPVGSLVEGELGLDALSDPPHLWTQVPTSRDPSGRIDLLAQGAGITLPLSIADGGTGSTTAGGAVTNLGGPWVSSVSAGNGLSGGTITTTGTIGINAPISIANGGSGATSLPSADAALLVGPGIVHSNGTIFSTAANWTFYPESPGRMGNLYGTYASTVAADSPIIGMQRTRGTLAAPVAVQSGDALGGLLMSGYPAPTTGVAVPKNQAGIGAIATQAHTVANHGTRLEFTVTPNNANQPQLALTIEQDRSLTVANNISIAQFVTSTLRTNSGRLIATNAGNNPSLTLSDSSGAGAHYGFWASTAAGVMSIGRMDTAGTAVAQLGSVNAAGNLVMAGTITPGSDERSKTNIRDYDCGLDEVMRLRPRQWERGGEHQAGLVGQELGSVIPDAVKIQALDDISDFHFINESAVTAALINAVKELAAKVAELESANGRSS